MATETDDLGRYVKRWATLLTDESRVDDAITEMVVELRRQKRFKRGTPEQMRSGDDDFIGWCASNLQDVTPHEAQMLLVRAIVSPILDTKDLVRVAGGRSRNKWRSIEGCLHMFSRENQEKAAHYSVENKVPVTRAVRDLQLLVPSSTITKAVRPASGAIVDDDDAKYFAEIISSYIAPKALPRECLMRLKKYIAQNDDKIAA